jgi:hypothetical protein
MPWILREKSKQTIENNENHEFIYEFIWIMILNLQIYLKYFIWSIQTILLWLMKFYWNNSLLHKIEYLFKILQIQ